MTIHLHAASYVPSPAGATAIAIFVGDADELHGDLVERGPRILKSPETVPHAMRDSDVADLDGNTLIFGHGLVQALDWPQPRAQGRGMDQTAIFRPFFVAFPTRRPVRCTINRVMMRFHLDQIATLAVCFVLVRATLAHLDG